MRRPLLLFLRASGTFVAAVPLIPSAVASAQTSALPIPRVTVSGSCPEASSVESVLAGLLPAAPAPTGLPATATVTDLGDSYAVVAGDQTKTYLDPARDCAERARVAAVFVALAFEPRGIHGPDASPPDTSPAPPPPTTSRPARSTPEPAGWLRLDARGTYDSAPASGVFAPGVAVGIALGQGRLGGQAICGWMGGGTLRVPGEQGAVVIERFPCALGPILRLYPATTPAAFEVTVSAGIAVGALRVRGTGFASSYESARLELGARAALDGTLHLWAHPPDIAPVLGLQVTYDPMEYDLEVVPHGVVAHTPSIWGGVTAGVCWTSP